MAKFLIIKPGQKVACLSAQGDFEHWIASCINHTDFAYDTWHPHRHEPAPDITQYAGIIMTGSGAMVTEQAPWMLQLRDYLAPYMAAKKPILGICFGHQFLAWMLGATVDFRPQGREVGTYPVSLLQHAQLDTLFADLPVEFAAHLTHQQSVLATCEGMQVLAKTEVEAVAAFCFADHCWGVQFHPEFTPPIMEHYLNYQAPHMSLSPSELQQMQQQIQETRDAAEVLRRFVSIVKSL
jgi:GMP synthase (glutamine-hydrolysing)